VEFAVSPQVGQAVLACPTRAELGPLLEYDRAKASTACPTREVLAIERNGSAHFHRQFEIAGRHQEF